MGGFENEPGGTGGMDYTNVLPFEKRSTPSSSIGNAAETSPGNTSGDLAQLFDLVEERRVRSERRKTQDVTKVKFDEQMMTFVDEAWRRRVTDVYQKAKEAEMARRFNSKTMNEIVFDLRSAVIDFGKDFMIKYLRETPPASNLSVNDTDLLDMQADLSRRFSTSSKLASSLASIKQSANGANTRQVFKEIADNIKVHILHAMNESLPKFYEHCRQRTPDPVE